MEIYNGTYCVYIHTNKENGKVYIGKTIYGNKPNKRWRDGNGYITQSYFYKAIEKYTWDGFIHQVVASNLTNTEASSFERLLIKQYNSNNPQYGYNCTNGGEGVEGYHHTDESKIKYNNSMKKHLSNPNYIAAMQERAIKKPVCQFSLNGDFIAEYPSIIEAERQTGINNASISKNALEKTKHVRGYIFVLKDAIDTISQRLVEYETYKPIKREKIIQLTLEGEFVAEWPSSAEAGRQLNISYKNINAVCRGVRRSAGGYLWKYISEYNANDLIGNNDETIKKDDI